MITSTHYMILSAALFMIGVFGVMLRRNIIIIFLSIELILNAVNINLIAFSNELQNAVGQVFAIFVIAVAAAEAAVGLGIILVMAVVSALAPYLHTVGPIRFSPARRLRPPSEAFWFGTDSFGRDVYSRVIYGGRISLAVGFGVAILATIVGLAIGLVAGYVRLVSAT